MWTLEGEQVRVFEAHTEAVYGLDIALNGEFMLSASFDKTLIQWTMDATIMHTYIGHTDDINSCAISPDCQRSISACDDDTLKLWDTQNGQCLRTFSGHSSKVLSKSEVTAHDRY